MPPNETQKAHENAPSQDTKEKKPALTPDEIQMGLLKVRMRDLAERLLKELGLEVMSLNHIEGQLFTFDIVGQGFVLSNRVKVYGEGPNGYEDSHFRQYMYIRFRSDGTNEMST